jgi:GSCFA family
MAEFRTTFSMPTVRHKISLDSQLLTFGSCFAEVIGNQLKRNKLEVDVNPFGTLFNPLSIFKILSPTYQSADNRLFVESQNTWFHYDFHSQFSSGAQETLAETINLQLAAFRQKLLTTNFLFITLGTAFAYRLAEPPTFVANCHKMPANLFEKDLLSVKDVCKGFSVLYKELKDINPNLRIVLTLSPVRHTKDGIPENQLSKSILRSACHYLVTDYESVEYFPAYELMMDDLRDYRFYKADLIHPNEVAEAYIFEKFSDAYFDDDLKHFVKEWQQISRKMEHRPFNEKSEAHQKFLAKLLKDLEQIHLKVDVLEEIERIKERMTK